MLARRSLLLVGALALLCAPSGAETLVASPSTAAELLEGVRRVAAPGVPGPLCVYGPDSTPAVVGGAGDATRLPVVAIGSLGQGRVVAFGHDGYFGPATLEQADTARLLTNAVRWAGRSQRPRVAVLARPELAAWLRGRGFDAVEATADNLDPCDVALLVPWAQTASDLASLDAFVRQGGGLVVAATGWGWAQLHPGQDLQREYAGNLLLAAAGIQWANDWLDETADGGGYAVDGPPSLLTGAAPALAAAIDHETGARTLSQAELAQVSRTLVANALCAPPDDTLFLPRLRATSPEDVVPSVEDPVATTEVLDRVAVTMQTRTYFSLPVAEARAHPAAASFPGVVPQEAPRLTDEAVPVDTSVPGWHSTALYAPAGEPITVRLPEAAATAGLGLQIGAHTDRLWNVAGDWTRMPEVTRVWPLESIETAFFNPFGGLVYVTVPEGDGLSEPIVTVRIGGAVRAPVFRLGTNVDAWPEAAKDSRAPWGEIIGRNMIVTAPGDLVRAAPDPSVVADTWDRLLDLAAELATEPMSRARPERFVTDRQLAYGYMHAGYPLFCHIDQAAHLVDVEHLLTEGNWGFFHEVGHNHQHPDWTFSGTVEVTVNLFTLYAFDRLVGMPPLAHERGDVDFVRAQMAKFDFDRPDFALWQSDPFLALAMYVQLQHAFGWEAYRTVFDEYRRLPDAERPITDADKRDQWLVRFSRAVGRDLGPFFAAWGVPTTQQARDAIADLPGWMPRGFPETYEPDPTPMPTPSSTSLPTQDPTAGPPGTPTGTPGPAVPASLYLPAAWRRGG